MARFSRKAVLGAILAALCAGRAFTQDLYYLEAEKDGRLYVFADKADHDRWSRGKSVKNAITLRNYGPRGEDVVFDGEAAVNLYNERHARTGMASPVAPAAEPPTPPATPPAPAATPKIRWNHGTTFEFEHALVNIENRLQFRFTDEFPPDTLQLPGTSAPGDAKPSFKIRRAKTQMAGWLVWKELTYEFQVGWAGSDSGQASGTTFSGLEDAYLNWDISKTGVFAVRGGQFKVPFGRQEYTSSEKQQFVDRSILSGEFTKGRDVGVQAGGSAAGGKLSYALGAFNGNGRNKPTNDNAGLQWDGRVTFQPFGDVGYSEGDFESKDHPLVALEAEFEHNDFHGVTNANDFEDRTLGANAVFKYKGLSAFAEYFWRDRSPETGSSFGSNGYQLQAGYFVKRDRVEVAVRWASWDPTDTVSGNDIGELGGALSYYLRQHKLKVQGDFRKLEDKGRGQTAYELRLQTQFVF